MTGAIFCESRPATIIRSAWRGEGRKTSAPKRATSKRAAAMDIISMAQQAKPKPSGHMELLRAQFTALSRVVKMMPSSSRRLPKSSGLARVTCLPREMLMVFCLSHFRTAKRARQMKRLLQTGLALDHVDRDLQAYSEVTRVHEECVSAVRRSSRWFPLHGGTRGSQRGCPSALPFLGC